MNPMIHTFFLGHTDIEKSMVQDFKENRLPHAMIFYGLSGIGKETFAYRFIRFLLSNPSQNAVDLSVSQKAACVRQVAENTAPNFYKIEPNPEKKTQIIDVDQIRTLKQNLYRTIEKNERRVILIHPADTLNGAAANALLKILEEPPERTYFILITNTLDALLPTILSRCRLVRFSRLSDEEVQKGADFFKLNISSQDIKKAQGSLGKLFKYVQEKAVLTDLDEALKHPEQIESFIKKYSEIESLRLVYDALSERLSAKNQWVQLKKVEGIWNDFLRYDLDRASSLLLMIAEAENAD